MYDYNFLLNLFKTEGLEAGIKQIDIDKVEDITLQVILRTLDYTNYKVISYLETNSKNSPK